MIMPFGYHYERVVWILKSEYMNDGVEDLKAHDLKNRCALSEDEVFHFLVKFLNIDFVYE